LRGQAIDEDLEPNDPVMHAIEEFRHQLDDLIDEQKMALDTFLSGMDEDSVPTERAGSPALAKSEPAPVVQASVAESPAPRSRRAPSSASAERLAEPAPAATLLAPEPASRAKRGAASAAIERLDEPSRTPPRPVSSTPSEPAPAPRSDDPRERLDALAKRFDRKLREANSTGNDSAQRTSE
jgi:hypothetical protein